MRRIAYLVHNLADSAVARRVVMLRAGGAEVMLAGFCRDAAAPAQIAGVVPVMLGRTHDAALARRVLSVAAVAARPQALVAACRGADVLIARNLEMLVLAARVRRALGIGRVVYESLDIHRALLGTGLAARGLRAIERRLVHRADLVLHSSPGFERDYFAARQRFATPRALVENRVLCLTPAASPAAIAPGPPWRIGWFGNLRCRRTLDTLSRLVATSGGAIEVLVAGRASPAEFPDFCAAIARSGLEYAGPYTAADLPGLYARCHFAWAIDYFEEGLNSRWLLPNRLYEAAAHGAVPIALGDVETGRWLAARGAGLVLDPHEHVAALRALLMAQDAADYAAMRDRIAAIDRAALIAGPADCAALVALVSGAPAPVCGEASRGG